MRTTNSWLFEPIRTLEDAEKTTGNAVKGFYGLAAIQLVGYGYLSVSAGSLSPNLFDPVFLATNAWIVRRNKSRLVSGIIFLYSLLALVITFDNKFVSSGGENLGGTNLFLAIIFVYVAFRCLAGTRVYHLKQQTTVNWKEVVRRSLLAPIYGVLIWVALILVLAISGIGDGLLYSPDTASNSLIGVLSIILLVIVAYATALGKMPLTGESPLTESELTNPGSQP